MKAKRILSTAIALTLAFGMVSCGDAAKSDNAAKDNGARKSAAPALNAEEVAPAGEAAEEAPEAEDAEAYDTYDGGETAGLTADGEFETFAADMDDGFAAERKKGAALADGEAEDPDAAAPTDADPGDITNSLPEAGQLTAGEWNDNDNWGFFANLVNNGTISFPSFNVDPRSREAVTLKGDDREPIANAKVRLVGTEGGSLWSAVTDRQGRAYLFSYGSAASTVEVEYGGDKQSFEVSVKGSSGDEQSSGKISDNSQELTFKGHNGDKGKTDAQIMFIVDTTGSMSDEMLFLQSEFSSIVEEVGSDNVEYAVNFYRDEGDDYVTKCMDFTTDITRLRSTIAAEYADGGGDIPEAVGAVMQESITDNSGWRDDCVKIAFMIFDAPPHAEDSDKVEQAVRAAADKGIKLIPIVSSNSERETELFGRAVAIATGGTYVFLTDDSGIGDSHLEPIIGEYEVEKLYDIIIRLINDYRA